MKEEFKDPVKRTETMPHMAAFQTQKKGSDTANRYQSAFDFLILEDFIYLNMKR